MKNVFFELPYDSKIKAAVAEAVPASWTYMNGTLRVPAKETDYTEYNLAFLLNRDTTDGPLIINLRNGGLVDPVSILGGDKRPYFVRFEKAGYLMQDKPMSFVNLKRLATNLLGKNYYGQINFFHGALTSGTFTARCSMILEPWEGTSDNPGEWELAETGPQGPRVRIGWYSHQDEEGIQTLIQVCRKLGLKEYQPKAATV